MRCGLPAAVASGVIQEAKTQSGCGGPLAARPVRLVYGFNPDNLSSDPGAYDVFNGALGEFDDAFNVGLYAAENGGALVPTTDIGTDLISTGAATDALDTGTVAGAATTFLEAGLSDLTGYFDLPSPF